MTVVDTEAVDRLYELAIEDTGNFVQTDTREEARNAREFVLAQLQRAIETPSTDQVASVGLPLLAAHAALGAEIGRSARAVRPAPGEVVVLWTPAHLTDDQRGQLVEIIRQTFEAQGADGVTIMALPEGMALETLDADAMGAVGWSRV